MVAYSGSFSMLDNWLINICNQRKGELHYSSIRLWGSIGYATISILLTYIVKKSSSDIAYYASFLIGLLLLLLANRQDEPMYVHKKKSNSQLNPFNLFHNHIFTLFLFVNFMIHFSIYASTSFVPFLITEIGADRTYFSAISGLRGITEVPILLIGSKLVTWFDRSFLLAGAGMILGIELLSYSFTNSLLQITVAQCAAGVAYGLFLCVGAQYVYDISPNELSASAQSLRIASVFVSQILASLLGGWFVDYCGARVMFFFIAIIQLLSTVVYFSVILISGRSKK